MHHFPNINFSKLAEKISEANPQKAEPSTQADPAYGKACIKILESIGEKGAERSSHPCRALIKEYLNHQIRLQNGDTANGRIPARLEQIQNRFNSYGEESAKLFSELIGHTHRLAKAMGSLEDQTQEISKVANRCNEITNLLSQSRSVAPRVNINLENQSFKDVIKAVNNGRLFGARQFLDKDPEIRDPLRMLAVQAAYEAGFRGKDLVKIVAIAEAESTLNPLIHNPHGADNSRGFWQINIKGMSDRASSIVKRFGSIDALFDPFVNATFAFELYQRRGGKFSDWSVTKPSSRNHYSVHLAKAQRAVDEFLKTA